MTTIALPDDLVVHILSRLPLKSFCRFKCVCKFWLAFSSDPHYRQKLPRTPYGLLCQKLEHGSAIHHARLPSCDRDIDTTLFFVPSYEHPLTLNDCSNGLLVCHSGDSNAIVCNPATEEWMLLPCTQPGLSVSHSYLRLGFDPLWSQHFYVFNFQWSQSPDGGYKYEVKVFSSEDSTWSSCLWETSDAFLGGSLFVRGVFYVKNLWTHQLLALDVTDTCSQLPNARTIQLPGFPNGPAEGYFCEDGCLSLSCGVLCYAQQELDGCMMRIWSLEGSGRWVVKHRLSMNDVFGRELLLRTNSVEMWYFDYDILAIDLERELVIVADQITDMVFSFSISTGKLSEIWIDSEPWLNYYYVPYYNKFPASVLQRAQVSTIALPDDLVVEILSRLPLKSFCRFKCVCKSWLAFSSDAHYRQKLPRTPTGFLYQKRELDTSIHLTRLPSSDRDIDITLRFLPCDGYPLELHGCSNGLLLSYSRGSTDAEISNAIVCNPATEEWMELPYTQPGPTVTHSYLRLCFDPLWSQHFYVFNFQDSHFSEVGYKSEVKVFFSENSTWSSCLWESDDPCWSSALFVNGVLYVQNTLSHDLLALDAPDTCTQLLNERTIQLPGFASGPNEGFGCWNGHLSQSCGILCFAQQELDGCMMRIWSLEGSDKWVVKHRLNITNVLGRDIMLRSHTYGSWYFEYDILDFDLERELVILVDRIVDNVLPDYPRKGKVLAFSISTGKLLEIWNASEPCWGYYYVPYYRKFPASVLRRV
ncbi:hypothetical protein QYE76_060982 [Lolium multiflorum]|uniref:F-box domain-containing protein n=1 Tax=Lolium multiflorum TaxID=4521 RepID=A0AAD8S0C5_LOLMU|nr:hypothetical protein QYE76_060982 [Lolium multiflorum]